MKKVLFNQDNLKEKDIDETVIRTKGIIVNEYDELLLGYSNKTYQFPGGHLEPNETLIDCLKRELKEETGIDIKDDDAYLMEKITYYNKNYRNSNKNRKNEIYFYIVNTKTVYDINKTNLTKEEKEGNYTLKLIPLDKVEDILIESISDNPINKIIVEEMLEVLKEYKKIK